MTIKKKILSFIMIILITFVSITGIYFNACVYANELMEYYDMFSLFTQLVGANEDVPINVLDELVFDTICPYDAGFLTKRVTAINYDITKKAIAAYLNKKYSNQDKNKDNITQSDINEYAHDLNQNITYTDNSTTYNDNSKDMINLAINSYLDDNRYYVGYSLDLYYYDIPEVIEDFVKDYQYIYYVFGGYFGGSSNTYYFVLIPKDENSFVFNTESANTNYFDVNKNIKFKLYNNTTFNAYNGANSPRYNCGPSRDSMTNVSQTGWNNPLLMCMNQDYDFRAIEYNAFKSNSSLPNYGSYAQLYTYGYKESVYIYGSYNLFTTSQRGYAPYYYNNEVYTDFSTSSGDYTVNNDNRNYVTYGDVTTYIDDHHTETGDYPSVPDIEIWIENQPNPTPNPTPVPTGTPSGGSGSGATANANNEGINININNNHNINVGIPSLSGNTVSGNGSGSSGGFFDWISDIGGVIGDFIKNVGQLLADAIRGIAEAISSILETVPNVLSSIVEFVYGGLPDELKALVTLGITAVVFVSVIKILRK